MSLYAIGDIHGCVTALKKVFDTIDFKQDDTIVFLGDYVDRGPDTKGTIDYLLELQEKFNTIFIRGNHDIMMMEARLGRGLSNWLGFGGSETLDSYGLKDNPDWPDKISPAHWDFLESTLPYHEINNTIFVHGGLAPNVPLWEQTQQDLYWEKYVTPDAYTQDKTVICGHTARKNGKVADFGHTTCIDTFAYGGQWLTCLDVEERTYLQTSETGQVRSGVLS